MNKSTLPLLLGGGAVALYFATRKRADETEPTPADLERLMHEAGQEAGFDRMIDNLAGGDAQAKKFLGPLLVTIKLNVSGGEKFAIGLGAMGGESGLKKKALELAKKIQARLPRECSGAPPLIGDPTIRMKSVDGGYKVFVQWVARWTHTRVGPLRGPVVDCMTRLLKADPDIGKRVASVTAVRLPTT